MARTRQGMKGRRESGRFVALPHLILKSDEYPDLSPRAVKLVVDLMSQYNGKNNGDFTAAFSVMRRCGWRSKSTLPAAVKELVDLGFIMQTRLGWRNHTALFGVTWLAIDACEGKLDVQPGRSPLHLWKACNRHLVDQYRLSGRPIKKTVTPPAGILAPPKGILSAVNGNDNPARRAVSHERANFATPPAGTFIHLRHGRGGL